MAGRIAIAAALAACACGNPPEDRADRSPELPAAGGPTELPDPPSAPDVEIELLDPGAEPRRALRYRPRVGSSFRVAYTMEVDYGLELDGHRLYGERASSRTNLELTCVAARDDAIQFELSFRVEQHDYAPITGEGQRPLAGGGTVVVSSRGRVVSMDIPRMEKEPALQDLIAMSDFFFILPEEPVGEGARWKTTRRVLRNGMSIEEIETHQLTDLAASGGVTEHTLDQRAEVQVLTGAAFDRGPLAVFELSSLSSEGTGETRFALDHPVPERARTDFSFVSRVQFRSPEREQASEMTMTAGIALQRSPMGRQR